jgi:hypothetical protein
MDIEKAIEKVIKQAVEYFDGADYRGEATSRDEAIEIVRNIIEDALERMYG